MRRGRNRRMKYGNVIVADESQSTTTTARTQRIAHESAVAAAATARRSRDSRSLAAAVTFRVDTQYSKSK